MPTIPVNGMACGLPGALSVMYRIAVRVPESSAKNFTVMLQVLAGASEEPQVVVKVKSSLSDPLPLNTEMLVMLTVALPRLERVTVCVAVFPFGTVPKLMLLGEMLIAGCVTSIVTCAVAAM